MRQQFFILVGVVVLIGAVVFFLIMVAKAFYTMFSDWRMQKQLNELANLHADRRRQQREQDVDRLNTGCEHEFGDWLGALPPNVCSKCGLSRERPSGACDHIWRRVPGPIPGSRCEKCGELYGAITQEQLEEYPQS